MDTAKGLAILLVIFGHGLTSVIDALHISAATDNASVFVVMRIIYAFHMPLFFFIGGLFASHMLRQDWSGFLSKKATRLVIPYFAWCFIQGVVMQLASHYTTHGYGMREFLLSPVVPFMEYWFLYVLFFIHVLYYLVCRFMPRGSICYLLLSAVLFVLQPMVPDVWILQRLAGSMLFFAVGTYALSWVEHFRLSCAQGLGTLALFVLANWFFVTQVVLTDVTGGMPLHLALFSLTALDIFGAFALCHALTRSSCHYVRDFLDFCGAKSMELYCTHVFFLVGMRMAILRFTGSEYLWGKIILISVVTVWICYALFRRFASGSRFYKILFGV